MAKYAFLDAVDVKLYPAGTDVSSGAPAVDPEGTIVIDYLNESSLTLEAESQYARIKGANAVAFSSGRTGQFTINAEVVPVEYLAMILGGSVGDDGSIQINDEIPSVGYVAMGTFKGKEHGTNAMKIFELVLYNITPQANAELTLNATDIGSFPLTFDILADEDGNLAKLTLKE